jgi:hypothetical protein
MVLERIQLYFAVNNPVFLSDMLQIRTETFPKTRRIMQKIPDGRFLRYFFRFRKLAPRWVTARVVLAGIVLRFFRVG